MSFSDDLDGFIRTNIKSLSALELLLLLYRERGRSWSPEQLNRELRSSVSSIRRGLLDLERAGLVAREANDMHRFRAARPELERLVRELEETYGFSPLAVVRIVFEAPTAALQSLADAFRIKKENGQ